MNYNHDYISYNSQLLLSINLFNNAEAPNGTHDNSNGIGNNNDRTVLAIIIMILIVIT